LAANHLSPISLYSKNLRARGKKDGAFCVETLPCNVAGLALAHMLQCHLHYDSSTKSMVKVLLLQMI
jgi:hypothetical protein